MLCSVVHYCKFGSMPPSNPIHNASQIYAEGVTSSLLAAERTYLAWVRTIISIVGFGLVLARYFSPTNAIGSFVAFTTTSVSGYLLYMATERYFHIIWMLDHKQFDADRLTPFFVTSLLGCLLALVIFGGAHAKMVERGWIRSSKTTSQKQEEVVDEGGNTGSSSIQQRSRRSSATGSTGGTSARLEQRLLPHTSALDDEEETTLSLTAVLTADAIS